MSRFRHGVWWHHHARSGWLLDRGGPPGSAIVSAMTNTTSLTASIVRRLPVLAGVALVPLAVVVPAHAATPVICVGNPTGTCDDTAATIPAALAKAAANETGATILVGPGTYSDGPYYLDDVTLKGSGQGQTILTLPASTSKQTYLSAENSTVEGLTVKLTAADSSQDTGIFVWQGSEVHDVTVDGAGTYNATALHGYDATISSASVSMPLGTDAIGVSGEGGLTVTDSTISARTGFRHSGANKTDRVARVRINATGHGIATDSGTVEADSVLIDLGTSSGTGLSAVNYNASTSAKAIVANHVSIVGGGDNSQGAVAWAANPTVVQQSTIWFYNSIVEGPKKDMVVTAGTAQLGTASAKIIASYTSYTSWYATTQPGGVAQVLSGTGRLDVDPKFADPAAGDYRLTPGSPVVDKGDPAAGGSILDLAAKPRVVDGDGNGTAVRDMGAYELPTPALAPAPSPTTPAAAPAPADTIAPTTSFTKKPGKRVTRAKVRFGFTSDEAGVTFSCKLDKGAWRRCTSPTTLRVKVGKHRFSVRATDAAGNTDATPATFRFTRVRVS
jgi:hypothetical protein